MIRVLHSLRACAFLYKKCTNELTKLYASFNTIIVTFYFTDMDGYSRPYDHLPSRGIWPLSGTSSALPPIDLYTIANRDTNGGQGISAVFILNHETLCSNRVVAMWTLVPLLLKCLENNL